VAAAREIGGRQIQNRGTLAGNIANASPAGDALPVLAAADATIVLASADGERRVPMTSFYTGYRQSVRHDNELIVAIDIPHIKGKQWWRKVGTRRAQAISKVMMAGVNGPAVRLAVGSVAPTVLRLRKTEQALSSGASLEQAIDVLSEEITPIDDIRSTAEYRRRVTVNLLTAFVNGH
jgi:CO/xanthine dehydrogenase FAD-binding subunit